MSNGLFETVLVVCRWLLRVIKGGFNNCIVFYREDFNIPFLEIDVSILNIRIIMLSNVSIVRNSCSFHVYCQKHVIALKYFFA